MGALGSFTLLWLDTKEGGAAERLHEARLEAPGIILAVGPGRECHRASALTTRVAFLSGASPSIVRDATPPSSPSNAVEFDNANPLTQRRSPAAAAGSFSSD